MAEKKKFERTLNNSQIQLIALGGTIGTGLFLGVGDSISKAGPVIVLIYILIGAMLFLMMRALGELILSDLSKTSYTDFIQKYLGKNFGLTSGYLYWFAYIFLAMAEITALGMYFRFWFPNLALWIPGTITIIVLLIINLISAKFFGNLEFSFAIIKLLTIVAFTVFAIYMLITGKNTTFGKVSLANIFDGSGFFPNGTTGFLEAFQMAIFSFVGIEMIGFTASEAKNPKKVLPNAINQMPLRIILFYVLAIISILVIVPWRTVSTNSSPFVQALQATGIKNSASLLNLVVISAAVSSTNSVLYSAGRLLYSLSKGREGKFNKKMSEISPRLLPQNALIASAILIALAPLIILVIGQNTFTFISTITTSIFILIWVIMIATHLKFRKEGERVADFSLPFAPYSDYLLLVFFGLVVLLLLSVESYRLPMVVAFLLFGITFSILKLKETKKIS